MPLNKKQILDTLASYKKQLEAIDVLKNKSIFFELMQQAKEFIFSLNDKEIAKNTINDDDFIQYKNFFRQKYVYAARSLETMQVISILTQSIHTKEGINDIIQKQNTKECYFERTLVLENFNFKNAKNFYAIGTGPMMTIGLIENIDLKIFGININPESGYLIGEVIRALSFDNFFYCLESAKNISYKDADLIYISPSIYNKITILEQIQKTAKPGTQILFDAPLHLTRIFYEKIDLNNYPGFTIKKELAVNHRHFKTTLIKLIKN